MYSKLIFSLDNKKIEFHLHEIVAIAKQLVEKVELESVEIQTPLSFASCLKEKIDELHSKLANPFLLIPYLINVPSISILDRPGQWLYAADAISRLTNTYGNGMWCKVADRLLLIRSSDKFIEDHGNFKTIIWRSLKETLSMDFMQQENKYLDLINLIEELESRNEETRQAMATVREGFDATNGKGASENFLKGLKEKARFFQRKRGIWQEICKMPNVNSVSLESFLVGLSQENLDMLEFTNSLKALFIMFLEAFNLARGEIKPLYRFETFGPEEQGAKYIEFANEIEKSISNGEITIKEIAINMRKMLTGETPDSFPNFLPTLTAAWFCAESSRNPTSMLTGLMIIDMVQNDTQTLRDPKKNLYSWRNILAHPENEEAFKNAGMRSLDLYGDKKHPFFIGGCHPMAHKGSVEDSKKEFPRAGLKLNMVRQKEGSLILHWLFHTFKHYMQDFPVDVVEIDFSKKETIPDPKPQYNEIYLEGQTTEGYFDRIDAKIKHARKSVHERTRAGSTNIEQYQKKLEKLLIVKKKREIQKYLIESLLMCRISSFANLFLLENDIIKKIMAVFLEEKYDQIDPLINNYASLFSALRQTDLDSNKQESFATYEGNIAVAALDGINIKKIDLVPDLIKFEDIIVATHNKGFGKDPYTMSYEEQIELACILSLQDSASGFNINDNRFTRVLGLGCQNVLGDGFCLFRAIAKQVVDRNLNASRDLSCLGLPTTMEDVLYRITDYFNKHSLEVIDRIFPPPSRDYFGAGDTSEEAFQRAWRKYNEERQERLTKFKIDFYKYIEQGRYDSGDHLLNAADWLPQVLSDVFKIEVDVYDEQRPGGGFRTNNGYQHRIGVGRVNNNHYISLDGDLDAAWIAEQSQICEYQQLRAIAINPRALIFNGVVLRNLQERIIIDDRHTNDKARRVYDRLFGLTIY